MGDMPTGYEDETKAMAVAYGALKHLDRAAWVRALTWLQARLKDEDAARAAKSDPQP